MSRSIRSLLRASLLLCALTAPCLSALAAYPAEWTTPIAPFHIAGNLYYVGSRDLAAYLVTTPAGNLLINQNLESSPAQIRHSVEQLGFRWQDTKILLNSQAHFDHVAGAAAIAQETGAKVCTMQYDAVMEEAGGHGDFSHEVNPYPPVHVDRVLHDGETVSLAGIVLTAHRTGGHTRGCTTWTMDVLSSGHVLHVVIVGGLSPLDDYQLVATPGRPTSYPGIAQDFEHTFATMRTLPCDIFLGAHGVYFHMLDKLARVPTEGERAWVDPAGYHALLDTAQHTVQERMQQQESGH